MGIASLNPSYALPSLMHPAIIVGALVIHATSVIEVCMWRSHPLSVFLRLRLPAFVNYRRDRVLSGVLRMDMMAMVSSLLAAQAGNTQMQVAATMMKQNANAEKSAVMTLLGAGQNSPANLGAGIGGNLDVTA